LVVIQPSGTVARAGFELYVDEAAWGAHETTDHFKTAVAQLLPKVTRREPRALHSVPRQL
jgi:quinol monooxygenase YgiN